MPRPAIHALAALIALVTLVLGLVAAGLPARLLLPGALERAHRRARPRSRGRGGRGLAIRREEAWIRLTVLLGAPALLTIAAMLAFWPARRAGSAARGRADHAAAAVRQRGGRARSRPARPPGLVLLVLVGAWLWLPRLPRREALLAAAVTVGVGVLSIPVATALDANRPWWDYHAWNWFGGGKVITFDWTHPTGRSTGRVPARRS